MQVQRGGDLKRLKLEQLPHGEAFQDAEGDVFVKSDEVDREEDRERRICMIFPSGELHRLDSNQVVTWLHARLVVER